MGKSHRLFWICESSLELPKPIWRPNSTWVSIAILQRLFQCKHHVIQVNCFFVFFVAHYVLQHVYIYNYIYKHISIYLIIYLLRYRYVYYVLMFTDISVCVHASAQVITTLGDTPKGDDRVFRETFRTDKRSSGTGPFTQSQSMGGWLLRLVMCLSRHVPKELHPIYGDSGDSILGWKTTNLFYCQWTLGSKSTSDLVWKKQTTSYGSWTPQQITCTSINSWEFNWGHAYPTVWLSFICGDQAAQRQMPHLAVEHAGNAGFPKTKINAWKTGPSLPRNGNHQLTGRFCC